MARFSQRCEYDGYTFASHPEKDFYIMLKKKLEEGVIKGFSVQPKFQIQPEIIIEHGKLFGNEKISDLYITPDFGIETEDGVFYVDTKGGNVVDEATTLRRKLFLFEYRKPLICIGVTPKYLGGKWVEVTKGKDFLGKLKRRYDKMYPEINKRKKDIPRWTIEDWEKSFDFDCIYGLFYCWKKTKTLRK